MNDGTDDGFGYRVSGELVDREWIVLLEDGLEWNFWVKNGRGI